MGHRESVDGDPEVLPKSSALEATETTGPAIDGWASSQLEPCVGPKPPQVITGSLDQLELQIN